MKYFICNSICLIKKCDGAIKIPYHYKSNLRKLFKIIKMQEVQNNFKNNEIPKTARILQLITKKKDTKFIDIGVKSSIEDDRLIDILNVVKSK